MASISKFEVMNSWDVRKVEGKLFSKPPEYRHSLFLRGRLSMNSKFLTYLHSESSLFVTTTPNESKHDGFPRRSIAIEVPEFKDMNFSPFNENVLAVCSRSKTYQTRIFKIIDDEEEEICTDLIFDSSTSYHSKHSKRAYGSIAVGFHPTCSNVLIISSNDNKLMIWDVEKAKNCIDINFDRGPTDFDFNKAGNIMAITNRDKSFRLIDPRISAPNHEIAKINRVTNFVVGIRCKYMKERNLILVSGKMVDPTTRQTRRGFKVFDPRKLGGVHSYLDDMNDNSAKDYEISSFYFDKSEIGDYPTLHYDSNLQLLFVGGVFSKRLFLFSTQNGVIETFKDFKFDSDQRGMNIVPNYCSYERNFRDLEFAKLFRLSSKGCQPLSFRFSDSSISSRSTSPASIILGKIISEFLEQNCRNDRMHFPGNSSKDFFSGKELRPVSKIRSYDLEMIEKDESERSLFLIDNYQENLTFGGVQKQKLCFVISFGNLGGEVTKIVVPLVLILLGE